MIRTISAVEARHRLGQLMNEVQLRGDHYIIERAGKPIVAVVPIEDFNAWRRMKGSLAADSADARYPLRGRPVRYDEPFQSAAGEDWESSE